MSVPALPPDGNTWCVQGLQSSFTPFFPFFISLLSCLPYSACISFQELTSGTNDTDHEILVQLYTNSNSAGQSAAENERFRNGLRQIVQELRESGTQDIEQVADRIARYRREFLEDPSKILGL